jgi:hypothetical protein
VWASLVRGVGALYLWETMGTAAVGEDIEALCGRCGQVWHVVMAKVGDKIAKVVCKRCHGLHLYRTDNPADAAAPGRTPSRKAASQGSTARVSPRTPLPVPAFDPSKPPRAYSVLQSFAAGERVQHPVFGSGVVTGSPGAGKVEIAFPAGRRVLASAKATSTLARPVLLQDVPIADRPPDKM